MMPTNLILIRHGESEGNVAVEASKRGDNSYFTDRYVTTPGTQWRLTDTGVAQAQAIGRWVRETLPRIHRYYVSPYVRTRMTAVHLGLPEAEWRLNRAFREREWGEIEALPRSSFEADYPNNARMKKVSPLYWAPPSGESLADVAENRVRNILDTLHRECGGKTVLAVTHAETMQAHRLVLERWSDEEFLAKDKDPAFKITNCQALWYHRPEGEKRITQVQVISPLLQEDGTWRAEVTSPWRSFVATHYDNASLWDTVKDVPSLF